MKAAFRQSMAWLHTWSGLLLGWLLYFIFLTGTAGYFDTEIDRWMQPERPLAGAAVPTADAVAVAIRRLEQRAPQAAQWSILPPNGRENPQLRIFWRDRPKAGSGRGARGSEYIDVQTGQSVTWRRTGGGQLLYRMHHQLHYLPTTTARWIVGVATMFMLVAIVRVITHRRIFRNFFVFRPAARTAWLDAHNVLAVLALPFHVMITYTGLVFIMYLYMAPNASSSRRDPAPWRLGPGRFRPFHARLRHPVRGDRQAALADNCWGAPRTSRVSLTANSEQRRSHPQETRRAVRRWMPEEIAMELHRGRLIDHVHLRARDLKASQHFYAAIARRSRHTRS